MGNGKMGAGRGVSVALTGSGGAGVMTAGTLLLEAAARAGLYGLMVRTSGPQIRGGEAAALLRVATTEVSGLDDRCDLLVALDWQNVHRFADEIPLDASSCVISDAASGEVPETFARTGASVFDVGFKAITKSIPGSWPNMIALGVAAGAIGIPVAVVELVIERSLKRGRDRLEASVAAAREGYSAGQAVAAAAVIKQVTPAEVAQRRWMLSGNEATGFGAVRGGVRFVAAYPITPATEVLEWLASALPDVGGALVQAEDELASINMVIGASFGGAPSLTATAGPGLALMTEALGLAVIAEIPIVVVDVMRGGPSTGIPAKSEQSDLNLALWGLPGDAPRVVLAPNSIADCLVTTQWAVHLAEILQTPVIVLSDQFFGQTQAVIDRPSELDFKTERLVPLANEPGYRRYADTASGISPMALPGTRGVAYIAESLEHTERGIPSSGAADHHRQLEKRARKIAQGDYAERWADLEGEGNCAVITFGSATGPVREALARMREQGGSARLISMRVLAPVLPEQFAAALEGVERIIVVEQNHGGQLYRYLRAHYDLPSEVRSHALPGPLPFRPAELLAVFESWSR